MTAMLRRRALCLTMSPEKAWRAVCAASRRTRRATICCCATGTGAALVTIFAASSRR